MFHICIFILSALLFFILSPGILLNIPAKSSKKTIAIVHSLVFSLIFTIIWYFAHKLNYNKKERFAEPPVLTPQELLAIQFADAMIKDALAKKSPIPTDSLFVQAAWEKQKQIEASKAAALANAAAEKAAYENALQTAKNELAAKAAADAENDINEFTRKAVLQFITSKEGIFAYNQAKAEIQKNDKVNPKPSVNPNDKLAADEISIQNFIKNSNAFKNSTYGKKLDQDLTLYKKNLAENAKLLVPLTVDEENYLKKNPKTIQAIYFKKKQDAQNEYNAKVKSIVDAKLKSITTQPQTTKALLNWANEQNAQNSKTLATAKAVQDAQDAKAKADQDAQLLKQLTQPLTDEDKINIYKPFSAKGKFALLKQKMLNDPSPALSNYTVEIADWRKTLEDEAKVFASGNELIASSKAEGDAKAKKLIDDKNSANAAAQLKLEAVNALINKYKNSNEYKIYKPVYDKSLLLINDYTTKYNTYIIEFNKIRPAKLYDLSNQTPDSKAKLKQQENKSNEAYQIYLKAFTLYNNELPNINNLKMKSDGLLKTLETEFNNKWNGGFPIYKYIE